MVHTKWYIRKNKDSSVDPIKVYGQKPYLFSLKIYHGGVFTKYPGRSYIEGKVDYVDLINSKDFSLHELNAIVLELGYNNSIPMYYHYKLPTNDLDFGLQALGNDEDIINLLRYTTTHKLIEVYTEEWTTKLNTYFQSPNSKVLEEIENDVQREGKGHEVTEDNDDSNDSDSDSDSDFMVDEDNIVGEVEVNMDKFNLNVEGDVKWVGCTERAVEACDDDMDEGWVDLENFASETDSDEEGFRKRALEKLKEQNKVKDGMIQRSNFYVGQAFGNKEEIKEMVSLHAVETRRDLYITKNDKERVRVICRGNIPVFINDGSGPSIPRQFVFTSPSMSSGVSGTKKVSKEKGKEPGENKVRIYKKVIPTCPWVVHISKGKRDETWRVKTYKDVHKCLQTREVRKCTSAFLSKDIEEQIIPNPDVPPRALHDQLQKKYEVGLSQIKIYRAKQMAIDKVRGDYAHQYSILRDYILEVQTRNPNTTVKVDVEIEPDPSSPTRQFKRIYFCLGAAKQGFREGLRDLLGLDGCFMKEPAHGQILTAVSLDANNGIYPYAYAMVEAENSDSWTWFLECLAGDLDLNPLSNFTFVSDRQKGIIQAISKTFPCAEHRYCLKHIYENMKSKWKGELYKKLLWKCATATTIQHFNHVMEELKRINVNAYEWLKKIPPRHWSRSHFTGRSHCDVLLNNMCEVFNRQLVKGRDKPIISALEFIREYLMRRIVIVQKTIDKSDGPLTPAATRLFDFVKTQAAKYIVKWNGGHKYQVTGPWMDQCVVDVVDRVCSCRKWELTGMPCKHLVAVIWDMGLNQIQVGTPESWVHPAYRLATWKKVYTFKINPISGRSFWIPANSPTILTPPKRRKQVGRPKKKRKKAFGEGIDIVHEGKLSRIGRTVTCKKCKKPGHNSRGCTGQETSTSGSQAGGASGLRTGAQSSQQGAKRMGAT